MCVYLYICVCVYFNIMLIVRVFPKKKKSFLRITSTIKTKKKKNMIDINGYISMYFEVFKGLF